MNETLTKTQTAALTLDHPLLEKIVISLAAVLVLWLLRWILLRVVQGRTENVRARYYWRKTSGYVILALSGLVIGGVWLKAFQSLATFLGLLSAGLAIALKDPLVNLAGWIYILWQRPFAVGDRIQIGEHAGDVIDLRLFETSLMEMGNWVRGDQSTGRVMHIPNGKIFSEALANYTREFPFIWNEIPVLLTFESNWEKAKKILEEIAAQHARHLSAEARQQIEEAQQRLLIIYPALTPVIYTSVEASGIQLTIRYICAPSPRRDTEDAIWLDILREFARHPDIDFAYPTQRWYDYVREKSTGSAPPGEKEKGERQRN
ncbi:MAG: mechanosensitive ion channel domain-containing protein [PVC group bacterium]